MAIPNILYKHRHACGCQQRAAITAEVLGRDQITVEDSVRDEEIARAAIPMIAALCFCLL
jgi:hypothetical protein